MATVIPPGILAGHAAVEILDSGISEGKSFGPPEHLDGLTILAAFG